MSQEERRTETRNRLLTAAAELFADHGIDAVSVDAVAEAAGRTSGAVYDHFGSKQGLLLALLDFWKDSVRTVLFAEVAVTEAPEGQLGAVWENVAAGIGPAARRGGLLEQELVLRAARDPEVATVMRERAETSREFSAGQLAAWTTRVGATPLVEPEQLAVLVTALLAGLAMQNELDPDTVTRDLAVRGLAALVGLPLPSPSGADADTSEGIATPEDIANRPDRSTLHQLAHEGA
jgi:AcrR family transcriptional regulator